MSTSVSYDPDELPDLTDEVIQRAKDMRMHVVHVICDEPEAKVGDAGSVAVYAVTAFVPRVGELIRLEDGNVCRVESVMHRLVSHQGCVHSTPTVWAVRTGKRFGATTSRPGHPENDPA